MAGKGVRVPRPSRDSLARLLEIACWTAGNVLLLAVTWTVVSGILFQRVESARLDRRLAGNVREVPGVVLRTGDVLGRLEIPRLKLSVIVAEGDDTGTLRVAAGHLSDSPLPWEGGNSVFAAHRDSYLRPLQRSQHGDLVRLTTIRGTFLYKVTDASIVEPDDLSVMNRTRRDSLTLITCYPFSFVGTAPQRFVVRAERVPDTGAAKGSPASGQIRKAVTPGRVKG